MYVSYIKHTVMTVYLLERAEETRKHAAPEFF